MGFAAYTDWLQAPATTGQVTYTVTGFGYLPKLLILRANGLTTSNGGGFDMLLGIGAATSSSHQAAVYVLEAHNSDTTNARRGSRDNCCIIVRNASNADMLVASLVSFALDGNDAKFTLDWSVTSENAHVQFDLFGGDDFEAHVKYLYAAGNGSENIPHGLTDDPSAVFAFSAPTNVIGGSNPTHVILSAGVSDGTTTRSAAVASRFNLAASDTLREWSSSRLLDFAYPLGTQGYCELSGWDDTNATVVWSNLVQLWSGIFVFLRGVQAHVGETTIPAAGNLTISGCPFQPAYGMFLSPCGEGSGNDARMMIGAAGAATGSRSMSIGITEQDNQDVTNARRFVSQNIAVNYRDHAGNVVFTGRVDEFTSDGADIIMSANPSDGLDYVLGYMFLAEAASGAYSLTADVASFTFTGQAAGITAQRKLTAATSTFTATGQAATLRRGYRLAAVTGEVSLTGQAASLLAQRKLGAEQQAYTLDGQAVGLAIGRMIAAAVGAFSLTGQDVTLSYSGDDVTPTVPGVELRLGSERLHYRVEE